MEQQKIYTYPKLIKSDIKLTIGMLVSNHRQYIRNAMEALKPLLEAVPSELVVVDTMGEASDGSIDIVREYTDKIFRFEWCNDFSAARNFCLSKARGEWFLYQDDDEWFDNVQELIDFFNSKESEEYYSGYYYTRDYLPGGTYSTGIAGRIIRRTERTRFTGKVHEHFEETFAPNKEFSCFTHHYGYAYENAEQQAAKQKRNVDILSAEIAESGLTPQRAAQMAQELFVREETMQEGYLYCLESIASLQAAGELNNSCSQWLLTATVRYFSMAGDNQGLLKQAERILMEYPLSNVAQAALAATAAPAALAERYYDLAMEYCELYFANYEWKLSHPEEALEQMNLDFPRLLADIQYYKMVHTAAVAANEKGEYLKANRYWKRLPLGKEGFDAGSYARDINETLQGLRNLSRAEKNKTAQKKKILFLPYKAAMWDSLESVWMAAQEDEGCEAKVMPIPYYDKRQDGSFGELHDEQGDFPGYVPITDWRTYDLKAEHPDVIFFHNPYDEYNYVTSVHPRFYSGELKKVTDLLVYIPYFVSGANVNDHLCATMGVYNADKVVVQPGAVYETYKRVYVESLLELHGERMSAAEKQQYEAKLKAEAEEKFLPLGSPKLDRVTNCKSFSYDVPEEWQKLIGSGENRKKVVLLNFHLSSVAHDRVELFLKDADRVLDTFKQAKDIVLLWRPHPLMENTIASMAPGIQDRYQKMVESYRREGWGIYDDTPDFNRAVDLADAYYGDGSSLVEIFRTAGKPVMIRKAKE